VADYQGALLVAVPHLYIHAMTSGALLFLLLEFAKVIASAPVILGLIAWGFRGDIKKFLARVDKAKWGAAELSAPQQASQNALIATVENAVVEIPTGVEVTGSGSSVAAGVSMQGTGHVEVQSDCEDRLRAAEANATLWEYRFLNVALVATTQHTLDWLAAQPSRVTPNLFDNYLASRGVSVDERKAIYFALKETELITDVHGLLALSQKGHDYLAWDSRNRMHQVTSPTWLPPTTPPA
jgi:hypothetical protein